MRHRQSSPDELVTARAISGSEQYGLGIEHSLATGEYTQGGIARVRQIGELFEDPLGESDWAQLGDETRDLPRP